MDARDRECKCSARRGARFGGMGKAVHIQGWGLGGGPALRDLPSPRPRAPPHRAPPTAGSPFHWEEGGVKGLAGPLLMLWRFSLADFPPSDPPSPAFASRIPGGPKTLGRPLNWVLNPQPPGRPEPALSDHYACGGGSHSRPPLSQPAACKLGENSKPGSRAPPPGTVCTPLPQRLGSELRSRDSGGRTPGATPQTSPPALLHCGAVLR